MICRTSGRRPANTLEYRDHNESIKTRVAYIETTIEIYKLRNIKALVSDINKNEHTPTRIITQARAHTHTHKYGLPLHI